MSPTPETAITVVRALCAFGQTSQQELSKLTRVDAEQLRQLERMGLIRSIVEYGDLLYAATKTGLSKYSLTPERHTRLKPRQVEASREPYDGRELRPFEGRPGCNDAFSKPSRGLRC